MIFFRKKYQEVLGKYEKSKEEIKKLNKLLLETNEKNTQIAWENLCKITTLENNNAKLKKDLEKQKELNKELTIVNSDLNFKNECLNSNIKELKKEVSKQNRRIENLKKTRVLPSTKAPNQLMKVKLSASSKPSVRNHIKNEII